MTGVIHQDIGGLLQGWGYSLKTLYLASEVVLILQSARHYFPGKSREDRVPPSTYYAWLKAAYLEPATLFSYEEVERLVSLVIFLDMGGDLSSFAKILIEQEREKLENQNTSVTRIKTVTVSAERCA